MGVMTCARKGCDNIMCRTYVNEIGYVCADCQQEFKGFLIATHITPYSDHDIKKALKEFMATRRGDFSMEEGISVDKFFREHTNDY